MLDTSQLSNIELPHIQLSRYHYHIDPIESILMFNLIKCDLAIGGKAFREEKFRELILQSLRLNT